jgi:hypothetical protein
MNKPTLLILRSRSFTWEIENVGIISNLLFKIWFFTLVEWLHLVVEWFLILYRKYRYFSFGKPVYFNGYFGQFTAITGYRFTGIAGTFLRCRHMSTAWLFKNSYQTHTCRINTLYGIVSVPLWVIDSQLILSILWYIFFIINLTFVSIRHAAWKDLCATVHVMLI